MWVFARRFRQRVLHHLARAAPRQTRRVFSRPNPLTIEEAQFVHKRPGLMLFSHRGGGVDKSLG